MGNVQKNSKKDLNNNSINIDIFKNEESLNKRKLMNPKQLFSQVFKINNKSQKKQEINYQIPVPCNSLQNFDSISKEINRQSNSFETNPNSNKNIQEEEKGKEDFNENCSEEIEGNNEELKIDKLYMTKSTKKIFIEDKRYNRNNNKNEEPSISTFDYELNFYHGEETLRGSYISKLISTRIWNPELKNNHHNSLIIFDWDDTLLPTSFLVSDVSSQQDIELSKKEIKKMKKIEQKVGSILEKSIEKGKTYIITNAYACWIEYTIKKFYSNIINIFDKIKIISARNEYEYIFPGNARQWKIEAFLNILKDVDNKKVTNIVCMGDSLFEIEAGRILASKFARSFIKTVKFKETPKLDELLEQLRVICDKFGFIYSSINNLNIKLEKKKK